MDNTHLLNAAGVAHATGNLKEASRVCRQILGDEPSNAQAMLLLGVIEAKVGDPFRAAGLLEQVRTLDPTSFQAPLWQAIALKKLGRTMDAIQAASKAVELNPKDPQALTQLGLYYIEVRMLREAEACLTEVTALAPQVMQVYYSLSQCLQLQARLDEAIVVLRYALASMPQTVEGVLKLSRSFLVQNSVPLAAECARIAIELDPDSIEAHLALARILVEDNQAAGAEQHLGAILSKETLDAKALVTLGLAMQGVGRHDEAWECFQEAIELQPHQGNAYMALVNSRRCTESDRALLSKMHEYVLDSSLSAEDQSNFWYGIGKTHEDLGEFEEALGAYDEANRIEFDLRFRSKRFDRSRYSEKFDRTIGRFTAEFISQNAGLGSDSDLPIFVVGMMRSGTTLMEQILSSHRGVGGAGEQAFWLDNWRAAMTQSQDAVDREGLSLVTERYLALLQRTTPGTKRVVDKMPGNYPGLGIIHLALPHAKIIHMRRNPIDTCLSIYVTPNRAHPEFTHDRDNIVCAYREYERIMEHWRSVLPATTLLEIDYEDLVANSEAIIRKVVDFCGLEWDDACLHPEANRKSVSTPSAWQVRQPIYGSSSGRWRRFEPWLGAFLELSPGVHSC